jgi:chromosome segregation ATPase
MENNKGKEDILIKDLQLKITVLKKGVLEERNKKSELEKDINRLKSTLHEYEKKINEQDNIIMTLSKDKYELHSKLEISKSKSENTGSDFMGLFNNIFQKKDTDSDEEIKKLQNENFDLTKQVDSLNMKIKDQFEDFERCKMEYQNLLNLQVARLKKVENELGEKNKTIAENLLKMESIFETYKKLDIEKTQCESRLHEFIENEKLKTEKIVELLLKLEEKDNVISTYKESLIRHELESAGLARKLAELKNAIIEQNMIIQTFKGEKADHGDNVGNVPIEVSRLVNDLGYFRSD